VLVIQSPWAAFFFRGIYMKTSAALSLDHVGFMVRDLDRGALLWRKLGFQLSPRSPQMGKTPGAAMAPWATSNHCVMFEQGYLELIGITSPENFNPWPHFIDRFEGAHIAALRCGDAVDTYAALRTRIDGFDPPLQRRRMVEHDGAEQAFEFRNIFSQDDCFPEGRFILIEHQTPDVIWRPEFMSHSNGAVSLAALMFCSQVPDPTVDRLARMTGETPESAAAVGATIAMAGGGDLIVLETDAAKKRYPGVKFNTGPHIFGAIIQVEKIAQLEKLLEDNETPYHRAHDGGVWIEPQYANGGVMHFQQATA
jgi:hypothetical protein